MQRSVSMYCQKRNSFMKTTLALFFGLLLTTTSCKKDNTLRSLDQELTGKWELVRANNGWGGIFEYSSGNGNTISFTDSNYSQQIAYNDTTFNYQGGYRLYAGKPCDFADETTLINLSSVDGISYPQEILLKNGELSIGATECIADGGTNYYRKIE